MSTYCCYVMLTIVCVSWSIDKLTPLHITSALWHGIELSFEVDAVHFKELTHYCTACLHGNQVILRNKPMQTARPKDYAIISFSAHEEAIAAITGMHRHVLNGSALEVTLARPPQEKRRDRCVCTI
jgi:RNA recognition motif. (a.k.a. RRM, RBD, or RNP domain)